MKLFAIAFVSALLVSCAGAPKPPVGKIMGINAKPESAPSPYALVFDLETDFDANLKLKSGVKGTRVPITLEDLNRHWAMDAATKEELVRFALQWKERYLQLERQTRTCP